MTERREEASDRDAAWLSEVSADTVGGVVGAAVGMIGGPEGIVLGGAAGAATPRLLHQAREWGGRMLGRQERNRVGGVLLLIGDELRRRVDEGASLREDWFGPDPDPSGDEIAEGVLLQAGREYRERKLPFLAKLYASIACDAAISADEAHQAVALFEPLTWRQVVVLSLLGTGVSQYGHEAQGDAPVGLRAEMDDLDRRRLWGVRSGNITWNSIDMLESGFRGLGGLPTGKRFALSEAGERIFELAWLAEVPEPARVEVVRQLYGIG